MKLLKTCSFTLRDIIKKIFKTKFISKRVLCFFIRLHNLSYIIISKLAVLQSDCLHPKHRITNYHTFFINNVDRDNTILDIGCGFGALTYELAKRSKKVIGIDLNPKNIAIAKEKYNAPNIDYM